MQRIRKALTIVGGATLMAVMLGVAAFAFSAAVQPGLFANPGAITVGFASTADAQPAGVGPIVTCVPTVDSAKPPAAAATGNPARSVPQGERRSRVEHSQKGEEARSRQ